jgi:hypothetical protein
LTQKAQKKKLCKKKTPFLWGVAPSPIRFLKKAKPKTFKLGHSAIKLQAKSPGKIKSKTLNREQISVERTIFENSQKPFCKKVFCGAFFQKSDLKP